MGQKITSNQSTLQCVSLINRATKAPTDSVSQQSTSQLYQLTGCECFRFQSFLFAYLQISLDVVGVNDLTLFHQVFEASCHKFKALVEPWPCFRECSVSRSSEVRSKATGLGEACSTLWRQFAASRDSADSDMSVP